MFGEEATACWEMLVRLLAASPKAVSCADMGRAESGIVLIMAKTIATRLAWAHKMQK
jgi:hypothetical protein